GDLHGGALRKLIDQMLKRSVRLFALTQCVVRNGQSGEAVQVIRLPKGFLQRLRLASLREQGQREEATGSRSLRHQLQRFSGSVFRFTNAPAGEQRQSEIVET